MWARRSRAAARGEADAAGAAAATPSLLDPQPVDPRRPPKLDRGLVGPAWGLRAPGGGRLSHVAAAKEYQATTVQAAGLNPFTAGSGAPSLGVPIGRHSHWGEVVCLDPFQWLDAGLVTNTGVFTLGQPGTGKPLAVDTAVPTPSGWARLGDLRPGGLVYGPDGEAALVLWRSETMTGRDCYEVTFSDGTAIVAAADHLWVTADPALVARLTSHVLASAGSLPASQLAGQPAGWLAGHGPGALALLRAPVPTVTVMATVVGDRGEPGHAVPCLPEGRDASWVTVVRVEPVATRPVCCITVDRADGLFLAGPGWVATHNSSINKRLMRGLRAFGVRPLVLGDPKGEYVPVVRAMGGQVIRPGRGLDRVNPLDSGPLGGALGRIGGAAGEALRAEVRGRRLSACVALCSLVRRSPLTNGEDNVLGAAVDLLTERQRGVDPIVPDVLALIREGPERLVRAAETRSLEEYHTDTKELRRTLSLLCTGSLAGVFDGQTSSPIDLDAPGVCVDLSAVATASDTLCAAAMLSTWAYGFGLVDAAAALHEHGLAPQRHFWIVVDELWRAMRAAPGLVEHADQLTRLNRHKGVGQGMTTHSMADLAALPTEEDRKKAAGFVERCSVTVLAGLPRRELLEVAQVVPLSNQEIGMVASWAAPDSWQPGTRHPGRGKYLIKCGQRVGIPVEMAYVADEAVLYDTDGAVTRRHLDRRPSRDGATREAS